MSFDVINSSNLLDHISSPCSIHYFIGLSAKGKGAAVCNGCTFIYKSIAPTIEQYLETLFGFEPEMLPVVCGVSCIWQEGQHSGSTAIQPSPWSYASFTNDSKKDLRCTKLLVWKNCNGSPLVIPSLTDSSPITKAFMYYIQSACKGFAQNYGFRVRYLLHTKTAVQVL